LGGHFTVEKLTIASSLHGSGAGMGCIAGLLFMFIFLMGGSIVVEIAQ